MDLDQSKVVWSGFKVFVSMIKSSLKCSWISSAEVKSRKHFQDKKNDGGIRVNSFAAHAFIQTVLSEGVQLRQFFLLADEGRKDPNTIKSSKLAIIVPPVKYHLNGVLLACCWWPNIECWLGCFGIFQGILSIIFKKPYIFVIFQCVCVCVRLDSSYQQMIDFQSQVFWGLTLQGRWGHGLKWKWHLNECNPGVFIHLQIWTWNAHPQKEKKCNLFLLFKSFEPKYEKTCF